MKRTAAPTHSAAECVADPSRIALPSCPCGARLEQQRVDVRLIPAPEACGARDELPVSRTRASRQPSAAARTRAVAHACTPTLSRTRAQGEKGRKLRVNE